MKRDQRNQGWDFEIMPWDTDPSASRPSGPALSDNTTEPETLMVDRRGRPLIVREPRKIGFRKP